MKVKNPGTLLFVGVMTLLFGGRLSRPWNFLFGGLGVAEIVFSLWHLRPSHGKKPASSDHHDSAN